MEAFWGNIFRLQKEARDIHQFLAKIPIFAGLKTRELRAIERITICRHYKSGEAVFHKGDPGVGMYIVRSGSVRIVLPGSPTSPSKELFLARLGTGDFFGEASLPDGGARSATAIAEEETELVGLFRPDLLDLCQRDQGTGLKVLWNVCEVLAVRLRNTNRELSKLRPLQPDDSEDPKEHG